MDHFPFLTLLVPEQRSEGKPTTVLMHLQTTHTGRDNKRQKETEKESERVNERESRQKRDLTERLLSADIKSPSAVSIYCWMQTGPA